MKRLPKVVKQNLVAYSFILPNFVGFAVFTLIPLVSGLFLSFMVWDGYNLPEFVGLQNFQEILGDSQILRAIRNTVIYTVAVVPITMALALGLALILNTKVHGKGFFRTVSFFPYVASLVSVTAVWNFIFNPTFGPVNNFLNSVLGIPLSELPKWAADNDWAIPTAILFSVWKSMGYYMVIFLAGLQDIDPQLYEAASLDGANRWQKFRYVTVPQLSSTTFFVSIILVISSFKVYDIFINLFAGTTTNLTDATRVLVYEIYSAAFRRNEYGRASAISMILFLMVLVITLIQFYGEKRKEAKS